MSNDYNDIIDVESPEIALEVTVEKSYKNIRGWGIDADPRNEPTYPMKRYTGDDHKRTLWRRPERQPVKVEILMSTERPDIPAVFGTSVPPSGLSGAIRRSAFKYSENLYKHWLRLLMADRINAVEGILDDLVHGRFPNFAAERGWKALWKFNKALLLRKIIAGLVIIAAIVALIVYLVRRD